MSRQFTTTFIRSFYPTLAAFAAHLLLAACLWALVLASPAFAESRVEGKVVVLGDDLVNGYELFDEEDAFGPTLERYVFENNRVKIDVEVIAQDGATVLSSVGLIPHVMAAKPDVVLIALGYNDALAENDPDVIYNNLDTLLRELDRVGAYVMLVGVEAPPHINHRYATRFNDVFPKVTRRYRVMYVPSMIKEIVGNPHYTQPDRYHPNKFGVVEMAKVVAPFLHRMMKQMHRSEICHKDPFSRKSEWCRGYVPENQ